MLSLNTKMEKIQKPTTSKKGTLESLNKEELIKKCKGLLSIAQKAKQAKDDYAEENKKLTEELNKYESQKEADKKALIAMKEMVDNLTEQKLSLTTELSDFKTWKAEFQKRFESKEQIVSKLEIEKKSLNRQIKKLTCENEDLLSTLDNMEKKFDQVNKFSIQQQQDLVELEKETLKWKEYENIALNLQKQLDENLKKDKCFEEVSQHNQEQIEKLKTNEKEQNKKIQKIRQKLITVAMKLKKIKLSKNILLETIQEYSESVSNWQKDICIASSQLCDRITKLEKDKVTLENEKEAFVLFKKSILEEKHVLENKLKILNEEKQNLEELISKFSSNDNEQHQHQQDISKIYKIKLIDMIDCCEKVLSEYDLNNGFKQINPEQVEELKIENQKMNDVQEINHKLEKKCAEVEKLKSKLSECSDKNNFNAELEELKKKLEEQSKSIEATIKKGKYSEEIANLKRVLNEVEDKLEKKQNEYKENCKKLQILQENYDLQSTELEKLQGILQHSEEINSDRIINLEEKLISNEKFIDYLKDENKNLITTISQKSTDIDNLQSSLKLREIENSDLLMEMRELNEALKRRGDVISRQQEKIKELESEIKQTADNLRNVEINLSEKETQISEKETKIDKMNQEINSAKDEVANLSQQAKENEKIIKNLSKEVTLMRDKIPPVTSQTPTSIQDTQSESLSTSTYSKADDVIRMREADESLEWKYSKLRALAIKLKKKVQEQATYITSLESNENNKVQSDSSKLGNTNVQVKNLQALQNENDKLLDEIEKLKKHITDDEKQIKILNDNIKQLEKALQFVKDEKISINLDKDDSRKKEIENTIREYQNQIKSLKQEKESYSITVKELKKEEDKLKNTLIAKDNEIEKIQKQCEKIKIELEKKKAAEKKSNVLNLEIEAYEKSLNEITKKLEAKNIQIDELLKTLKLKDSANQSLQEQINLLEATLESEKAHSRELKQQIDINQAKIKENEYDKNELKIKVQDLTIECETLKAEVDVLQLQISEVASKENKLCTSLQNDKENLLRQILTLEEALEVKSQKVKELERDLQDLKAEYANYKVKAQAVLRQNQTKESTREKELEEEITVMHATIEALKLQIKSSTEQIENNERKFNELREDNERIQKRCKELIDLLEESRLQNDTLLEDNKKQCREYQESLKSHRLQIETLTNAYKLQIQDIEQKHSTEIEELKKRGISMKNNYNLVSRIEPFGEPKPTDEQKIDLILMEREDAEGSETNISMPRCKISSTRSKHDLIPLDELLNSSLDDDNMNEHDDQRSISPTLELRNTKERLNALENQVKHLTLLLAETEQDLAKLTQLNEVLKEEVRRHERTIEREKHMHNSEYMKNVILKFLTLHSGDERSRLVPVLNTIFKLSPEETQTLQNVAKGSDQINRGWGSYLPIWSNHQ